MPPSIAAVLVEKGFEACCRHGGMMFESRVQANDGEVLAEDLIDAFCLGKANPEARESR